MGELRLGHNRRIGKYHQSRNSHGIEVKMKFISLLLMWGWV